jgi:hypothetical protein
MLDFPQFTKDTFPGVTKMDIFSGLFGDVTDDSMYMTAAEGGGGGGGGPSIRPNAIPRSSDGYPRNIAIIPLMDAAVESYREMADFGGDQPSLRARAMLGSVGRQERRTTAGDVITESHRSVGRRLRDTHPRRLSARAPFQNQPADFHFRPTLWTVHRSPPRFGRGSSFTARPTANPARTPASTPVNATRRGTKGSAVSQRLHRPSRVSSSIAGLRQLTEAAAPNRYVRAAPPVLVELPGPDALHCKSEGSATWPYLIGPSVQRSRAFPAR